MGYVDDDSKEEENVIKVRGFTLLQSGSEEMNPDIMDKFIEALRAEEDMSKSIPQFNLKINQTTLEITSEMQHKRYSNYSNEKRWFDPKIDKNRLFAYGVTRYPVQSMQ